MSADENADTILSQGLSHLSLDWIDFSVFGQSDTQNDASLITVHYEKSQEAKERIKNRHLLVEAIDIGLKNTETKVNFEQTALEIEQILFANYYYYFEAIYYSKIRSLCYNLSRNANHLLTHYDAQILCYLPTEALASGTELDEWRAKYRHMLAQKMQGNRKQNQGIFECPNCHLKNTDYFSRQTRGADEPETIFVECFNCQKHFKR